ncbi:MAG: TonB-dependent receptor [Tannerella sp.]|nr:TonB-dependent receptor [Tannerella sp.]
MFNATTAYQYLDDDMKMDLDYSPLSEFTMHQIQYLNAYTEEITLKSSTQNNYQWSFGVFGFYNDLNTSALTTMGQDGVDSIMQKMFDQIHANNPRAPIMKVTDTEIPIPGRFKTPTYGGAIFHQSTYNNLFIDGLSLTAGVRLDIEKAKLDYDTNVGMNLDVQMGPRPISTHVDTALQGSTSVSFFEFLPKAALKYEFDDLHYAYLSAANGYKAGGYNIQTFADITQQALRAKYSSEEAMDINKTVTYDPEYSWNYEAGFKGELIKNWLYGEIAAFYIDVRNIQITKFVSSGQGRMLYNGGKAVSKGVEAGLSSRLTNELSLTANYGFTHATFKNNDDNGSSAGKYVPYAPQHTLALNALYHKNFHNQWIDRLNLQAQYNAAFKIRWDINKDVIDEIYPAGEKPCFQENYGTVNLRASVAKKQVELSVWGKNLWNEKYSSLYFESMGHLISQQGRPFQCGVDLSIRF